MKAYATIGQEPYTGFDNVLIPEPPLPFEAIKGEKQPWLLNREQFAFSAVAKAHIKTSDNWGMELDSDVFLSHEPEDRNTTPKLRAAAWIRQVGSIRNADYTLIEQGPVKLPGVPAIKYGDAIIEPYRFTLESNGLGVINYMGTQKYYKDERYVQRFYILPISQDEVVTVTSVRNKEDDFPNTQFSAQWEHFLKTLKREVANTRSSTAGSMLRTRRYYTDAFSFEIFTPDEETGNQWVNELGAKQSVTWITPQGNIALSISIHSHKDFLNVKKENENHQLDAQDRVKGAPEMAKQFKETVPVMTYLEIPLGTATAYGYREETIEEDFGRRKKKILASNGDVSIDLKSVYTPGKSININLSGSKAALDAHEKLIYKWIADFKFIP